MKKFTFFLMAALFCGSLSTFAQDDEIKVTPATDPDTFDPAFTFNKDYKYYCIYLDDATKEANLSDDQYVYIGSTDLDGERPFFNWDGSSKFVDATGMNSFGMAGNYMAFQTGSAGWSGWGINVKTGYPIDLSGITEDYTFHIALMSTDKDPIKFLLTDGSGHKAPLVFGNEKCDGSDPVANFERDGEWYNIDIPMIYLEDQFGFNFKKDNQYQDENIFVIIAGAREGFKINYDAVFFYGPKGTNSIKGISTVGGNNGAAEYYTIDGKKISKAQANATKGIYLVKENGSTKKVVNK